MMKVGVLNKIATKLDDTTNALHKYYTTDSPFENFSLHDRPRAN